MQNVSLTEHFAPPGVVAISQKSYDSLPDDLKEYLTESAIRFGKMEREMDEKLQEEMKGEELEEKGCSGINEVDKQSFIDTTASVYTEYAGGISGTVKVAEKRNWENHSINVGEENENSYKGSRFCRCISSHNSSLLYDHIHVFAGGIPVCIQFASVLDGRGCPAIPLSILYS